jgi:hypothetical protein
VAAKHGVFRATQYRRATSRRRGWSGFGLTRDGV